MQRLLEEPFIVFISGPRKSGKSYFLRKALNSIVDEFDKIYILCASLEFNSDYDEFRNENYPHKNKFYWYPDPDIDTLEDIFKKQSNRQKRWMDFKRGDDLVKFIQKTHRKRKRKIYRDGVNQKGKVSRQRVIFDDEVENPEPIFNRDENGFYTESIGKHPSEEDKSHDRPSKMEKILILLDDVVDSGVLSHDTVIDKYAMRGRHIGANMFISSQRITKVSINARDNTDMMILFSPSSVQEFESLIDKFVPTTSKKYAREQVNKVYDKEYEFVVIDNLGSKPYEKIGHSNTNDFLNNRISPVKVIEDKKQPKQKPKERKLTILS